MDIDAAGMEAYEKDLEMRRDKLRRFLLIEETNLIQNLVEVVKAKEEERVAELATRAAEAEKEREETRLELLHEKQLQQFVERNPELRDIRIRARTEDAKRANVAQIAQNEERRRYVIFLGRCLGLLSSFALLFPTAYYGLSGDLGLGT
jgi:hypothetical protein